MKTLTELFNIQAIATQESIDNLKIKYGTSVRTFNTWFFSYSGHVNRMDAKMYPIGWSTTADDSKGIKPIEMGVDIEESGIQLMYWFIYNNLTESSQALAVESWKANS